VRSHLSFPSSQATVPHHVEVAAEFATIHVILAHPPWSPREDGKDANGKKAIDVPVVDQTDRTPPTSANSTTSSDVNRVLPVLTTSSLCCNSMV